MRMITIWSSDDEGFAYCSSFSIMFGYTRTLALSTVSVHTHARTYTALLQPEIPANIPTRAQLLASFGLSSRIDEHTVIFVCHQTVFKLVPEFDRVLRFVSINRSRKIESTWSLLLCQPWVMRGFDIFALLGQSCHCSDILRRTPNSLLLLKVSPSIQIVSLLSSRLEADVIDNSFVDPGSSSHQ